MSKESTGIRSPSPRRRGAPVVERVLDLALEELARVGYHRLSIPDVAGRAGLNKTSLYRRWPTKGSLVGAALERAMGHDGPLPDTGSLHGDMLAFALSAASWADSAVGRGVMKTMLADGDDPELRALVARLMRSRQGGPRSLFARAIARGELDAKADVPMAMTVIAGALAHRIMVENARVTPAFVKRLVRLVVDGLTAEAR